MTIQFLMDGIRCALGGSLKYRMWLLFLCAIMAIGGLAWSNQVRNGLAVTGMNDVVSWGLYISNFTFLVGLAAAAVMLVLPSYILHDVDFKKSVLIGEGVAVAALIMCLCFVTADLGSPERIWHMMPVVGYFNWPNSMLTWDVIVLNGYLALNALIPFYLLFKTWKGEEPDKKKYLPFVVLSVLWAVGIHLVTAFLYAGLPARPFWNNALLGPRFLATAFAAGPSFIVIILSVIHKTTPYNIKEKTFSKLGLIITVAAQVNLVMLISELFKEFYHVTEHAHAAVYLFFGLHGYHGLVPWIWTAIGLNLLATFTLTINPLRRNRKVLLTCCTMLFVSVWIEKGMGLIIPGLVPSPLGEIKEYLPTLTEWGVTAGIWAFGGLIMTLLIRVAVYIELGEVRKR